MTTLWRSWLVSEAGKPSNRTTLTELNEARAKIAGGIRLGVSADKIRALPTQPAQPQPPRLSSLRLC